MITLPRRPTAHGLARHNIAQQHRHAESLQVPQKMAPSFVVCLISSTTRHAHDLQMASLHIEPKNSAPLHLLLALT